MANPAATGSTGSTEMGSLFGWAFGDDSRRGDTAYLRGLKERALDNAQSTAAARGLDIVSRSASYTVVRANDTLLELDNAPDSLIVRCTVNVTGPGAAQVHAEGPMNG